jgi:hypothetical protein
MTPRTGQNFCRGKLLRLRETAEAAEVQNLQRGEGKAPSPCQPVFPEKRPAAEVRGSSRNRRTGLNTYLFAMFF